MKIVLILLFAVIFFGCQTDPVSPKLGDEFGIDYNESLQIEKQNLNIKFIEVLEDSRCPEGAECVWEGNAKVKFEVNSKEIILNTYRLEPNEAEVEGYKIKLISVYPYPKINEEIKPDNYKCKVIVFQ